MDLNEFAFQKLKEIKPSKNDIISFPNILVKICSQFSIKKELCWKLLMDFKKEGRIEIVCCHGVKIKKTYQKNKRNISAGIST